jgi:hypothetical protein
MLGEATKVVSVKRGVISHAYCETSWVRVPSQFKYDNLI